MRILNKAAVAVLQIYRKYLSPMKMQCCRFYPSCSEYTIQAIESFGVLRGSFKGLKRLLRCHPFSKGGWDPVR